MRLRPERRIKGEFVAGYKPTYRMSYELDLLPLWEDVEASRRYAIRVTDRMLHNDPLAISAALNMAHEGEMYAHDGHYLREAAR